MQVSCQSNRGQTILKRVVPCLLAIAAAGLVVACSGSDTVQTGSASAGGGNDPQLRVQEDTQSVWLRFVDALTGEPIQEPLNVTLTDGVVQTDASGAPIPNGQLTVTNGEAFLTAEFENTDGFSVLVGNTANGILETGQTIGNGADLEIDQPRDIAVLRFTDEYIASLNASGLAVAMQKSVVSAQSDGSLPGTTLQSAPKEFAVSGLTDANDNPVSKTMGVARIEIEPGTRALDSAGNPIALNGPLTVVAVYFNPQQDDAIRMFPGGFRTTVENLPASLPASGNGVFISGGFAQFNVLTANGTPLTRFDRPLRLSIDMPKDIYNPDSGQLYQAGEQFPVFSYEESTGVWTFESFGLIEDKLGDEFNNTVSFLSNHLTSFNLDRYDPMCSIDITYDKGLYDLTFIGTSYYPFYIPGDAAQYPESNVSAVRETQYFIPQIVANPSLIDFLFNQRIRTITAVFYREGTEEVAGEIPLTGNFCNGSFDFGPAPVDVDYAFNLTENQSCGASNNGILTRVKLFRRVGSVQSLYRTVASTRESEWTQDGQDQRLSLSATLPQSVVLSKLVVEKYIDRRWNKVSEEVLGGTAAGQSTFNLNWTASDTSRCVQPGGGGAFQ